MTTGKKWAFEDFEEGSTLTFGPKTVTPAEIIEFASEFDAQPMHLDEEAGKASILGGLAASGWHTCAMFMRMMCDGFIVDSTSEGSPGIDFVRWKKPVLAGDVLTGHTKIIAKRVSKSKPGLGLVTMAGHVTNQRDETVLEMQNTGMFRTREAAR